MTAPDTNFEDLISNWDLFRDRLVLFLGAGASIGAKNRRGEALPSAYDLRNDLWRKFKASDPTLFNPAELKLMTLEHAAAIIETKIRRDALSTYLVDRFLCDLPLWPHLALPYLKPRSIFTTNYDELIELGYKSYSGHLDVVCNDREPMPDRTVLYKPHGSLTHANQRIGQGGLVITQFDYFSMIADYRQMLQKCMTGFGRTCVLIVGYSFGDMDIGAELYRLRRQCSDIPWYAIFPRDDPQVRMMYSKRLEIEQINRTFEDFLAALDDQKDFLPDRLKHKNKASLQLAGLIQ